MLTTALPRSRCKASQHPQRSTGRRGSSRRQERRRRASNRSARGSGGGRSLRTSAHGGKFSASAGALRPTLAEGEGVEGDRALHALSGAACSLWRGAAVPFADRRRSMAPRASHHARAGSVDVVARTLVKRSRFAAERARQQFHRLLRAHGQPTVSDALPGSMYVRDDSTQPLYSSLPVSTLMTTETPTAPRWPKDGPVE